MHEEIKSAVLALCEKVEEVLDNNDWPTHDESLYALLTEIREGLGAA